LERDRSDLGLSRHVGGGQYPVGADRIAPLAEPSATGPTPDGARGSAEDVQVREAVWSDPLVDASTDPSLHPTKNPSSNTKLAAQPSNGAPGSPSGDN